MPINAGYEYENAEKEFHEAEGNSEKLKALQKMLSTAPKHKGTGALLKNIKERIKKYRELAAKEKKTKKGSSFLSIKKEGAARICIVGLTNTGKSTLLSKITNAKPIISEIEHTTKLPQIGILDYKGIKLQIIEIPAITKEYNETKHGLFFLSLIRESNLLILTLNNKSELTLIKEELKENDIDKRFLLYQKETPKEVIEDIWKNLNLIKIYTKQPSKKRDYPPVALKKGSKIRDLAGEVHKDFIKKFKFARVWGKSIKHKGSRAGLDHKLKDEDVVELHLR
tara:strand:- start:1794 stop:2639 length:846 start_codon:yes stop_codon:yes gene_type:complete